MLEARDPLPGAGLSSSVSKAAVMRSIMDIFKDDVGVFAAPFMAAVVPALASMVAGPVCRHARAVVCVCVCVCVCACMRVC